MFPFWEDTIAPILEAAQVRRVVEIGALRGENTVQMLEDLGADTELHVIDPLPAFDPGEHEAQFPGRYVFHEDLSLNVLPHLPPMDAALIDGDHNWYTVYHELKHLSDVARAAGAPLPVLFLHDVLWPYGRRDLYYAPEQIPQEFRQPYAKQGMQPGRARLKPRGGLNPTMDNAVVEGGPRNGVMTALDDFIAEHDKALVTIVLPIYFGLAIVIEQERLDAQPELQRVIDGLDAPEAKDKLLELGEEMRLRAMGYQHALVLRADEAKERMASRYLGVLKGSLLNEHYLETEVRLTSMVRAARKGALPGADALRDPQRYDKEAFAALEQARAAGPTPNQASTSNFVPFTDMGRARMDAIEAMLDSIRTEQIDGDLAEVGTGRGGGGIFLRGYLDAWEIAEPVVWVADRFRASPAPATAPDLEAGIEGMQADLNLVRDAYQRFDLLDDRVRFIQGPPAEATTEAEIERLALLRIDGHLGEELAGVLEALYDRVVPGGFVVIDAGGAPDALARVEAFRADRKISATLEQADAGMVTWRKGADEVPTDAPRRWTRRFVPLAPGRSEEPVDLSVVVVFFNMKREAARTLRSLSRSYQRNLDDTSYEVIVVENGSAPDQRLGEEYVRSFGPEFRYLDMGDEAEPSPVPALNEGIRAARGDAFALMIDGAHVVTPGLLHHALNGLETYRPAVVATQQWYVGPSQQGEAMYSGYDQAFEDDLFEKIDWPANGYRLFEIGQFIGDRDWFDGLWESNCLFVSRSLLQQVGGFDASFSVAGGGYANLDLYERLGATPIVRVVSVLGEGSFHQVHGGTTTNQHDAEERRTRVFSFGEQYADLRGRPFRGPGKPIHYVGAMMTPSARRTKGRRPRSKIFDADPATSPNRRGPVVSRPVPDDLKVTFVEAVWHNLPWRHSSWLGRKVVNAPTDLLAYQEIINTVRPDWIIETGTGFGARTQFLASICDLVGHGQVLSIDDRAKEDRPSHERIRYLLGRPTEDRIIDLVRAEVGPAPRALVLLGARSDRRTTIREFEAYEGLVPVGSYVIIEDTIVNGHPVWPEFGQGPGEAAKGILNRHGDFMADPTMEKYSLTFNPGGYLKRIR